MADILRKQQTSTIPALRPKNNHHVDTHLENLRVYTRSPVEALTFAHLRFAVVRQGR